MRRWTECEDARARELAADGYGLQEIAAELGRGRHAAEHRLSRLGVRVGARGRALPDPDLNAAVLALVSAGLSGAAIGRRLGRSAAGVCRVLRRLEREGLVRRVGIGRLTRWRVTAAWADGDDLGREEARELARAGLTPSQIGHRLGRDRKTVRGWLNGG